MNMDTIDKKRMAWYLMQVKGMANDLAWLQIQPENQSCRADLSEAETYLRTACAALSILAK